MKGILAPLSSIWHDIWTYHMQKPKGRLLLKHKFSNFSSLSFASLQTNMTFSAILYLVPDFFF